MSLRIYAISRGMVGIYKNHGDTSIDTTVVHFCRRNRRLDASNRRLRYLCKIVVKGGFVVI